MLSSTSLAATSLALSALLLSATATPLQERDVTYGVYCASAYDTSDTTSLTEICTKSLYLACDATGRIILDPSAPRQAGSGPASTDCNGCICQDVTTAANSNATHVTTISSAMPQVSLSPTVPTCAGTLGVNERVPNSAQSIESQDYCTRAQVNTVCDASGVHVLGTDVYNVCKSSCTC